MVALSHVPDWLKESAMVTIGHIPDIVHASKHQKVTKAELKRRLEEYEKELAANGFDINMLKGVRDYCESEDNEQR